MERQIKFRAWDKNGRMYYSGPEVTVWAGGLEPSVNTDAGKIISDFELMQFIYLHDVEGKPIYEGDIIDCGQDELFEIEYYDDTASFICSGVRTGKARWVEIRENFRTTDREINLRSSKIVGNRYENPELLA